MIDWTSPFVLVFIVGTVLTFFIHQLLEFLDFKSRRNNSELPAVLEKTEIAKALFTKEKLEKIKAYEDAKYFFWIPKTIVWTVFTLVLVLSGFYPFVFKITCRITGVPHSFWTLFFSFFCFSILSSIPEELLAIPFSLYSEFKIEKKFGFSNMTLKLWLQDQIKELLVSLFPAIFLGLGVSFAWTFFENTWWLVVSILIFLFVLLVQIIYPKFIAPLFNKFEPLEEGELKTKLEELLSKTGFASGGLFKMDASRRSGHSNAYFSGFGKSKRIVLYDTLIEQLTADELVAVLGHELGHFKLKHILKGFLKSVPLIFIGAFALFYFCRMESLYTAFGFDLPSGDFKWFQFLGITLSSFVWGSISDILEPFGNISSRKHEYEADKFSAEICGSSKDLITGLVKLNSENLRELFPPAIYVWWNYSHPTLIQRAQALEKWEEQK